MRLAAAPARTPAASCTTMSVASAGAPAQLLGLAEVEDGPGVLEQDARVVDPGHPVGVSLDGQEGAGAQVQLRGQPVAGEQFASAGQRRAPAGEHEVAGEEAGGLGAEDDRRGVGLQAFDDQQQRRGARDLGAGLQASPGTWPIGMTKVRTWPKCNGRWMPPKATRSPCFACAPAAESRSASLPQDAGRSGKHAGRETGNFPGSQQQLAARLSLVQTPIRFPAIARGAARPLVII